MGDGGAAAAPLVAAKHSKKATASLPMGDDSAATAPVAAGHSREGTASRGGTRS